MAEMLKLGMVLMAVALVAAAALGLVNRQTAPIIAVQQEMARQAAMTLVAANLSPGDSLAFDSISVEGMSNPYASSDEMLAVVQVSVPPDPGAIGYVFTSYGKGYSSTVQTMVAVGLDGTVAGTTILYQSETPGLGANVVQPDKLIGRLTGLSAPGCLLTKDGGDIDAMTGCTITSRAVVNSVRDGLEAMSEADMFGTGPEGWYPDPPPTPDPPLEGDPSGEIPSHSTEPDPSEEGGAA